MLFVRRTFVAQYKQTILGPAWAIIQPLFTKISVRETSGIDILRKSGIHAEQVLDPVFFYQEMRLR